MGSLYRMRSSLHFFYNKYNSWVLRTKRLHPDTKFLVFFSLSLPRNLIKFSDFVSQGINRLKIWLGCTCGMCFYGFCLWPWKLLEVLLHNLAFLNGFATNSVLRGSNVCYGDKSVEKSNLCDKKCPVPKQGGIKTKLALIQIKMDKTFPLFQTKSAINKFRENPVGAAYIFRPKRVCTCRNLGVEGLIKAMLQMILFFPVT